jgi:hypothetical protein
MKKTQEQIDRQVAGLLKEKETLPAYSAFGTPNHLELDAMISVLKGDEEPDNFHDNPDDEDGEIYNSAIEAEEWINSKDDYDLFEE